MSMAGTFTTMTTIRMTMTHMAHIVPARLAELEITGKALLVSAGMYPW